MRLTVRTDDLVDLYRAIHCTVLVDGVDVTERCHTADDEEGKAWCFKRNADGKLFVDPADPDHAAEEVLTGRVEIILDAR